MPGIADGTRDTSQTRGKKQAELPPRRSIVKWSFLIV